MNWLDRLNLQPQERRAVLGGLILVALVLNYWLVWPYFQEWTPVENEMGKLQTQNGRFLAEIIEAEQSSRVQSTVWTQASTHGVTVNRLTPSNVRTGQTNQFFDEVVLTLDFVAGEEELVNFLHALGSDESMIRVKDITRLRLDPSQTKLSGQMSVAASFVKKPKATPPPAAKPPTAKPAAANAAQTKVPAPGASTNRPAVKK
jgi:type II secretory pathway component PulM